MARHLALLALAVFWSDPLPAQMVASTILEKPIQLGSEFVIHSAALGEDRRIFVHLPDGYDPDKRYPAVYVLDAEGLFTPAVAVAEMMPWAYRAPETIVVGIANTNRSRDFTTPWSSKLPPTPIQQRYVGQAGGANQFLLFLKTELIPNIEARYATAPYRTLIGHSLSGLFALHAASESPGLFDAIVAASPALSWNDDEVISGLAKAIGSKHSGPQYLFVSRAEMEFDDTPRAFGKLQELLRLRAPASFHWRTKIIEDEDHGTGMLPGLQAGLEWAFINWRLPSLVFDEGLESVEGFYKGLSTQYGFPILPPESELSPLAKRQLERNPRGAISYFRRWGELYPRSIDARVGLADAMLATGNVAGAKVALDEAIDLAATRSDRRLNELQTRRSKLIDASGRSGS